MNRVTIRRFDIIRTANIVAVLYAVIIAIVGLVIFLPITLLVGIAGSRVDGGVGAGIMGAGVVGALIFTLIGIVFYGVIGWVMTAIMVALYNVVAGRIGGLQVDVDIQGPYGGSGAPVPYGYQPGYGAQPAPYPGYGGGTPPAPPAGWGQPGG